MPMPTDAISLLEQDHRDLEALLKKLETEPADMEALVRKVADDFRLHAAVEEEIVYPAIERAAPKESEEVDDGRAEHDHIRETWAELERMSSEDPGYDGLLAAVTGEIRHHHDEEEQDIFPAWRKAVDPSQLEEIGRRVEERKAQGK